MNAQEILEEIDSMNYWDARVLKLSCDYFADEVTLTYEEITGNVSYNFTGCYRVNFMHNINYNKPFPSKQLSLSQIPYFLQDVNITDYEQENTKLFKCIINMEPMIIEILCKEIKVLKNENKM